MCTEGLLVVDVAYVNNNLVLLQVIEKFNIQLTQNVAMCLPHVQDCHERSDVICTII